MFPSTRESMLVATYDICVKLPSAARTLPVSSEEGQDHASEDRTSGVRFRVAGTARPKQVKGEQARTPDGAPVWTVRLTAIEDDRNRTETIWVEVAGEEPKLTLDDLVQVHGLTFAPWVSKQDNKIVRNFRAEQVSPAHRPAKAA